MEEYVSKAVHDLEVGRINDEQVRQNKRLESLENKVESLTELTSSVKLLAANMEAMAKEQAKMSARLEELEDEPAEKWKKAAWLVIAALIGAGIHYLFGGLV